MSMESWMPSLHAGLIERTRPPASAKVVPLHDPERLARSPAAPPAAPLRESAIARARRLLGRAPEGPEAPAPRVASIQSQIASADAHAHAGWSFRRRFGLTVRVHAAMRELLLDARLRTGRTTQSILHDALVQYLDRLDREPNQR
jgi:hypothetical protein